MRSAEADLEDDVPFKIQEGAVIFLCNFCINRMKLHIEMRPSRCGILESMNEKLRGGALVDEGQATAG